MSWLLNLFYVGLLIALSPGLVWSAWRRGKYRQGWAAKFWGAVPYRTSAGPCIWLHAVSLGEVNLLSVLLDELIRRRPDLSFYITTTTMTGYQAACRRYPQHIVSYCPLDFSWAVNRAIRRIRPQLLVLAELELWPNMVRAVYRSGARVAVVNGRLSIRSFRGYRCLRPLIWRMLQQVDLLAVQTQDYAQRFAALGAPPDRLVVSGSLKYDGAPVDRNNRYTRQMAQLAGVQNSDRIWLAGSTCPPEEQLVISVFGRLAQDFPHLRLFLVPRHPERFDEVAEILEQSGVPFDRRSQLPLSPGTPPARVLLVDSVGELVSWWGLAQIGFVGGSFGKRGGQNMIEPAGLGVTVCFGPRTENFRDVVQAMIQSQAATVVADANQLERFVRDCLDDPVAAGRQGQRARALVQKNLGAVGRTAERLLLLLEPKCAAGFSVRHSA
jgi:3-deoxy-D-manno-octulosonic-acid transferase